MLDHIQLIIQLCIGSSQETSQKIQELSKTDILEPPSFHVSLPLSLQVPAVQRLGGIRQAQTIQKGKITQERETDTKSEKSESVQKTDDMHKTITEVHKIVLNANNTFMRAFQHWFIECSSIVYYSDLNTA